MPSSYLGFQAKKIMGLERFRHIYPDDRHNQYFDFAKMCDSSTYQSQLYSLPNRSPYSLAFFPNPYFAYHH
jgi:hypothetical protein